LLRPHKSIITNIDNDHLEAYEGNFSNLKKAFKKFCLNIPFQGKIISYGDSLELSDVLKNIPRNIVTYGFDESNDFQIINFNQSENGSSFDLINHSNRKSQSFNTPMYGKHNVLNTVAAIVMSLDEGISLQKIANSLETCTTVERRFEIISRNVFNKKITLVDDYGHHPEEIKSTLDTLNNIWPDQKKIVIFQPHRYTRTKALFNEFVEILSNVNDLILMEVYPASEEVIKGYETSDLVEALINKVNVIEANGIQDAFDKLKGSIKNHSVILTQGAGNTSNLAKLISNS
jgi:UDP-N-acetylmuramate--alanine ligase